MIINATGTDRITLWKLIGGKIEKTMYRNYSNIFISGDKYDLEFLSRQFDDSDWVDHTWVEAQDIFGNLNGIKVTVSPSMEREIIRIVQYCGYGRKFSVFNAAIDPVLRFMAQNKLRFFQKDSLYDMDPDISTAQIIIREGKSGEFSGAIINGSVEQNLKNAMERVSSAIDDSTVIIYNNHLGTFYRFLLRMEHSGYKIPGIRKNRGGTYESYGQVHYSPDRVRINGKICISQSSMIYSESGMDGIYEISKISSLNPETASNVTPGTAVSSMEIYNALSSGILVPAFKDDHEKEKTIETLFTTDKGGFVLQPDPGIYENIYEIDFSSMYPTIIVNYNLSPETVTASPGHGKIKLPGDNPYYVHMDRGFLSSAIEPLLKERLIYKTIKPMGAVYSNRDTALKWLLVTSFGYTGYKNARFGRIELHEAITSIGRWALSRAMRICEEEGFTIIHGIVDSLWITGEGNIIQAIRRIKEETMINIVLDAHYDWLFVPPARSGLGSLNRYFGRKKNSGMKVRGIDLRRSDVPDISRKMQRELLGILSDCKNIHEIGEASEKLYQIRNRYISKIRKMGKEDFILNLKPTRRLEDYRVENIQKAAIRSMRLSGMDENPGQRMEVLVKDGKRHIIAENPEDIPDYNFYEKYIHRAFEPFQYIISYAKANRRITLENWLE